MGKGAGPEKVVREIQRRTRRRFSAEEKIRIVLEGLRGEESIVECAAAKVSRRISTTGGPRSFWRRGRSGCWGTPDSYTTAFHDLPFGLVDKVGLAFHSNVFGSTPDNLVVTRHLDTARLGMGLARLAGTPMMNLLVGGDLAAELEVGGLAAFRAYAEEFLTATYDASVAAAVERMIVHPWGTDEWTMGTARESLGSNHAADVDRQPHLLCR